MEITGGSIGVVGMACVMLGSQIVAVTEAVGNPATPTISPAHQTTKNSITINKLSLRRCTRCSLVHEDSFQSASSNQLQRFACNNSRNKGINAYIVKLWNEGEPDSMSLFSGVKACNGVPGTTLPDMIRPVKMLTNE
jgi:hypothetical protein